MKLILANKKLIRLLRVLGITFATVLLGYLAVRLLYPFLIAFVFALCMNPLVNFLEKRVKLARGLAVLVTMIFVIGGLIGGLFLLSIEIIAGIQYLMEILPSKLNNISTQLNRLMVNHILPLITEVTNLFNKLDAEQQKNVLDQIENAKNSLIDSAVVFLKGFMQSLLTFVQGLPNLATSFLFGLLGTFFISKDWYKLKSWFSKLLPDFVKKKGKTVGKNLKNALYGYFKSQVILVFIISVVLVIGLLILGVENAITIGILTGILDFLPLFGTGFVLFPWTVYSLINGDWLLAIGLPVLYVILVITRNLVEPKVLSSSIGLNTFATIISMFVGLKLFGFAGLIIGPVTLVIITTFIKLNIFKDVWGYIQGK